MFQTTSFVIIIVFICLSLVLIENILTNLSFLTKIKVVFIYKIGVAVSEYAP